MLSPNLDSAETHRAYEALEGLVQGEEGLRTGPFGSELGRKDYRAKGVPVVMPRDLVDGGIRRRTLVRVDPAKAEELDRYRLRPGDILLSRRGRLGRCAQVTEAEAGWLCGTGCFRLRLNDRIEPSYLVHYLRWEGMVHWLTEHAVGQTMANLNTRTVAQMPIWLPPRSQQLRLARLFDRLDQAIRLRKEQLELGGRLQATLMRDLVNGTRQGHGMPEGWQMKELGKICHLVNGHRFHSDDWTDAGLPIIRIQNLNGSNEYPYFSGYVKSSWWVSPGDLLLAWSGARAALGPTLWRGPKGVLNQHIFRIEPFEGVNVRWLFEALRALAPHLRPLAHGMKENYVHLRKGELLRFPLAVPPVDEQEQIARWSVLLEKRQNLREQRIDCLLDLRRGLRNEIFFGRKSSAPMDLTA